MDSLRQREPCCWRVYDKVGRAVSSGPVHLSRLDDALSLEGTWLFRAGDSPAWSQWHAGEDATVGHEEAQAFVALWEIVLQDTRGCSGFGGRQRRIQEVYERYKGNTNIHALMKVASPDRRSRTKSFKPPWVGRGSGGS